MSKRIVILAAIWTIAFVIALCVDKRVASWVHVSGFGKRVEGTQWAQVVKAPGDYPFTVVVAFVLYLTRRIGPKQTVFVLLAGIVSGANFLVKWIVGRFRPYKLPDTHELKPWELHPLWRGIGGLFRQHDLCFPSGHECAAAALATAIYLVWPRGAWIFVILALLVAIERPIENAHFVSDVIGAMGFAMLGTVLLYKALAGWMESSPKAM